MYTLERTSDPACATQITEPDVDVKDEIELPDVPELPFEALGGRAIYFDIAESATSGEAADLLKILGFSMCP